MPNVYFHFCVPVLRPIFPFTILYLQNQTWHRIQIILFSNIFKKCNIIPTNTQNIPNTITRKHRRMCICIGWLLVWLVFVCNVCVDLNMVGMWCLWGKEKMSVCCYKCETLLRQMHAYHGGHTHRANSPWNNTQNFLRCNKCKIGMCLKIMRPLSSIFCKQKSWFQILGIILLAIRRKKTHVVLV